MCGRGIALACTADVGNPVCSRCPGLDLPPAALPVARLLRTAWLRHPHLRLLLACAQRWLGGGTGGWSRLATIPVRLGCRRFARTVCLRVLLLPLPLVGSSACRHL